MPDLVFTLSRATSLVTNDVVSLPSGNYISHSINASYRNLIAVLTQWVFVASEASVCAAPARIFVNRHTRPTRVIKSRQVSSGVKCRTEDAGGGGVSS